MDAVLPLPRDFIKPNLGRFEGLQEARLRFRQSYVAAGSRTEMPRKRYKPEEIVAKLRQVDVLVSQGQSMADAIRQIGVSEVTFYRWRQEFGGLKIEQVKRLKDLELENSRLRKAVSDLTLDKLILTEAAKGNF